MSDTTRTVVRPGAQPVLRESDATNLAGQNTGRAHLSHSQLGALLACPQRYDYRYGQRLEPISRRPALELGKAFQYGIEHDDPTRAAQYLGDHWRAPLSQDDEDKLLIDETIVEAAAAYYLRRWPAITWAPETREMEYRIRLRSPWTGAYSRTYDLLGFADAVIDVGGWLRLIENKLLGTVTPITIRRLALDRQIGLEAYALWRATGRQVREISYRIVRKPSIRQRRNETPVEFAGRVRADYENPDREQFYGHEEQLFRSPDDLLRVEMELWQWAEQLRHARHLGAFPRNTSACQDYGGCEFVALCVGDRDADTLFRVRDPRPESDAGLAQFG